MKVHEFAKQINKESKEVVAALQEKGIDLKPQSLINEEGIRIVKNTFGITDTNNAAAEVDKSSAPAEEKKKKGIIFVSNPQNSKLQGGQKGNYNQERPKTAAPQVPPKKEIVLGPNQMINKATGKVMDMLPPKKEEPQQTSTSAPTHHNNRPAQSGDRPAYNNNRPSYNNNRPAQSGDRPSYNNNRPAQSGDRPSYNNNRPAQSGDRPAYNNNRPSYNNNRPAQNGDRPAYNNNRPAQSGDRPSYNNNRPAQNGDRPAYNNNRPAYNNNRNTAGQTGDRNNGQQNRGFTQRNDRPGFNNNRGPGQSGGYNQNGNRPYNNNERNQGRNDRPDNRFQNKSQGTGFTADAPLMSTDKHREDHRRVSQSKDKRSKKDMIYEDKTIDLNKAGRFIKPEPKVIDKVEEQIKVITVPEVITIKELAEKMKLQPAAIVKKLFLQGTIVTLNQELSFEEAENIAIEYEIMCEKEVKVDVIEELLKEDDEVEEEMITRAPVICVMGHVDHGKTSLLDAIRKTNVIDREAGGITQHIGAYMVTAHDRPITFLDTPGHEAFTAMRMRGANATDIAILVVAADDGVMPQTIEAINHAKAAGIEIIVAVNKMDKPNANIDRVKQELSEYELIPEDWGGSTVFAPVSAKSGDGIPELLEMILLTADILELKANPTRKARGLVIEAQLDKGRGPVATILVQKGTLKVGDFISAGASYGKVRAMIDDKGRRVKEATPSTPVEILGLSDVPNAGEVFIAHDNDKTARTFAETFVSQHKEKKIEETKAKMSLDDLFSQIKEGSLKELNLIIKADVQGSVEAVKESLLKLTNEEVVVKCIHGGVGAISESDVTLAATSAAIIIGFNVKPDVTAKTTAEREGVDIRLYKVIYKAIEDIQAAMTGMLDPVYEEKILGHAEIRQIFKASAIGNIAGSYILDGIFQRGCSVRISREGQQVFEGPLASLKRFKDDVKEVKAGFECGLLFEGFDQMKEFDVVEAYTMVEVPRK